MKKTILIAATCSLLLFAGACGNDPGSPVEPEQFSPEAVSELPAGTHALASAWAATPQSVLDVLEYEEFQGVIYPGNGGLLSARMSTWPKGSDFAIQVPPGALPGSPGDPAVQFSLRIPTRASYDAWGHLNEGRGLPLIMEFEPSHLNFLEDVIVHATYMPWTADEAAVGDWLLWSGDPDNDFGFTSMTDVNGKVKLTYSVPHFSRWETGGGGPPKPNVRE